MAPSKLSSGTPQSRPSPNDIASGTRTWMPAHAGTLQAVSSLVVLTRLWLRARNKAGPLGLDDVFIFPAWVTSIAFTAFALLSTEKYGSGAHVWNVSPTLWESLARAAWISEVLFLVSTCSAKCSVLFFYRRLTKGSYNRRWKFAVIIAIAVTIFYCVAFVLVLILSCSPTEAYWKVFAPGYTDKYSCTNTRWTNVLSGVLSVVTDFYSVLLPFLMLWNFEAPRRQKIALNALFSLGLLIVACGSVRTYYLHQLGTSRDLTWVGFDVFVWADLELQLSLICASAPALRVAFRIIANSPTIKKLSTNCSNTQTDSHCKTAGSSIPMSPVSVSKRDRPFIQRLSDEKNILQYAETDRHSMAGSADMAHSLKMLESGRVSVALPLQDRHS